MVPPTGNVSSPSPAGLVGDAVSCGSVPDSSAAWRDEKPVRFAGGGAQRGDAVGAKLRGVGPAAVASAARVAEKSAARDDATRPW